MIEIKLFKKFSELKLNEEHLIIVDSYPDEEYIKSLGFKVKNINQIHKDYPYMANGEKKRYLDELNKLLFISQEMNRELDETVIEIGNFITEYDLYEIEDKLKKENITHKNLIKIEAIHKKYKDYKEKNNMFDMTDALKYSSTLKYLFKNKDLYLYNLNYLDKTRTQLINSFLPNANKVYILKEEGLNLSYFEHKLKPQKKYKEDFKAEKIELETKMSILNFLTEYKKSNPEEKIGLYVINYKTFASVIANTTNKDINFILSIIKIYQNNSDLIDVDNILLYLGLKEERIKLYQKEKLEGVKFNKKEEIIEFFNNEELNKILNLNIENSNWKSFFSRLKEIINLPFIENIIKYIDNSEDIYMKVRSIINLYLAKKEQVKDFNGIELIPFSKINEMDKVFVLYGGIKEQKTSFLADIHRKKIDLVDSVLYKELQDNYIKSLLEFKNVILLDYKYGINEINEEMLPYDIPYSTLKIKNKKEKTLNLFYEKDYKDILLSKIENINMVDLPLLEIDINLLVEKSFNLTYGYLMNNNDEEIKEKLKNILNNIWNKENIEKIKNNEISFTNFRTNVFKELDKYVYSNFPLKYKSSLLIFKNKLDKILLSEFTTIKTFQKVEFDYLLNFDYVCPELDNKLLNIYLNIDKIEYIDGNKINIVFYDKEPFTWQNKYHKTKFIKEVYSKINKNIIINEIKYLELY